MWEEEDLYGMIGGYLMKLMTVQIRLTLKQIKPLRNKLMIGIRERDGISRKRWVPEVWAIIGNMLCDHLEFRPRGMIPLPGKKKMSNQYTEENILQFYR